MIARPTRAWWSHHCRNATTLRRDRALAAICRGDTTRDRMPGADAAPKREDGSAPGCGGLAAPAPEPAPREPSSPTAETKSSARANRSARADVVLLTAHGVVMSTFPSSPNRGVLVSRARTLLRLVATSLALGAVVLVMGASAATADSSRSGF